MGAAHWDANVLGTQYDFRQMTTDERKQWYGKFMGAVRRFIRGDEQPKARRRYRNHNRKGSR